DRLAKDVRTPIVNSAKGGAYPICGLTYLLVYRDSKDTAKAKALAEFIQWAIHDGQDMAESLDYAKLPAAVVKVDDANLMKLTSNGKPLLASRCSASADRSGQHEEGGLRASFRLGTKGAVEPHPLGRGLPESARRLRALRLRGRGSHRLRVRARREPGGSRLRLAVPGLERLGSGRRAL